MAIRSYKPTSPGRRFQTIQDYAEITSATPFKRPENGQFRPGTGFRQFVFDETGDTDLNTEAGSQYGGFGSLFAALATVRAEAPA